MAVRQTDRASGERLVKASRCKTALHAFDSADKTANTMAAAMARCA
jgi:hypothetical protein